MLAIRPYFFNKEFFSFPVIPFAGPATPTYTYRRCRITKIRFFIEIASRTGDLWTFLFPVRRYLQTIGRSLTLGLPQLARQTPALPAVLDVPDQIAEVVEALPVRNSQTALLQALIFVEPVDRPRESLDFQIAGFVLRPVSFSLGPRASRTKESCSSHPINKEAEFPRFKGSFWGVIASIGIPSASIACIHFTK